MTYMAKKKEDRTGWTCVCTADVRGKITKRHAQKKTCIRLYNTILGMLPQPPPTSCEYRFTTVPQTTRNLLKFQGMSPGFPEAALSHAKSGEDWSPFTSTYDRCERSIISRQLGTKDVSFHAVSTLVVRFRFIRRISVRRLSFRCLLGRTTRAYPASHT